MMMVALNPRVNVIVNRAIWQQAFCKIVNCEIFDHTTLSIFKAEFAFFEYVRRKVKKFASMSFHIVEQFSVQDVKLNVDLLPWILRLIDHLFTESGWVPCSHSNTLEFIWAPINQWTGLSENQHIWRPLLNFFKNIFKSEIDYENLILISDFLIAL